MYRLGKQYVKPCHTDSLHIDKTYQSRIGVKLAAGSDNEIRVSGLGELSLAPDRCTVTISVSSRKENVQDAKNSVSRRSDYITQTLYNHHAKGDISTSKMMKQEDGVYHLDAEVTAVFEDFEKCQDACNLIVEKLDENVKVATPEFSHSPQRLENLRRQASIVAVSNARLKATEMAHFLHAGIGRPVAVWEDDVQQWDGSGDVRYDSHGCLSVQQRVTSSTVYVCVRCVAVFELKSKGRDKDEKKD